MKPLQYICSMMITLYMSVILTKTMVFQSVVSRILNKENSSKHGVNFIYMIKSQEKSWLLFFEF